MEEGGLQSSEAGKNGRFSVKNRESNVQGFNRKILTVLAMNWHDSVWASDNCHTWGCFYCGKQCSVELPMSENS